MECIFISVSIGDNKVFNYYNELGYAFLKNKFKIVYIYDHCVKDLPENTKNRLHYTWPSYRPTKLKDFIFLNKLIKQHKPICCISVFGSVNVMTIVSYLKKVKNRVAWIRTTNNQINLDSRNKLKSKLLNVRKRYIYRLLTNVYTNSNGTRNDIIKSFKLQEYKIKVLHNLTNKSNLRLLSKNERDQSITIVGRLNKSKGHQGLIVQFKQLLSVYPSIKLNIIGTGPLENDLRNLVSELNLCSNVVFHGNVPNDLIASFFSKTLIGISASFSEAFGWVNIEALREGTPIISTPTEGAKDIIVENLNGEFFSHKQKKSLSSKVKLIISNWDNYSQGAVDVFTSKFSFESQIENHCRIIINNFK
ncbi:glycosyltransferase [Wenyingzhuangia aestuarii]|uniref:glycosyltransferase n=1 Tax=Wenyingzhuangia aestuarii TaxID=1647582 RepID=UPI0014393AD9|nr:glycosyltransferase [Wenyingzhuangia aestuarii]NJB81749.1 glycosyltransferase involved in cell wall biosynthesis [Wenyingzhuangia aestuarii]